MAIVILPYGYYLLDWQVYRQTVRESFSMFEPDRQRLAKSDVLLTVTNPHPVDASFKVQVYGTNGVEMTRPRGPGGSGFFDADFGFPASATLAPRNQLRFFLDTTTANADYSAFGWAHVASSLPLLLFAQHVDDRGGRGDYIPIVSRDELDAGGPPPPADGAIGTPPPPRTGALPLPVLEVEPPVIDASAYRKIDALLSEGRRDEAAAKAALSALASRVMAVDQGVGSTLAKARSTVRSLFGRPGKD